MKPVSSRAMIRSSWRMNPAPRPLRGRPGGGWRATSCPGAAAHDRVHCVHQDAHQAVAAQVQHHDVPGQAGVLLGLLHRQGLVEILDGFVQLVERAVRQPAVAKGIDCFWVYFDRRIEINGGLGISPQVIDSRSRAIQHAPLIGLDL